MAVTWIDASFDPDTAEPAELDPLVVLVTVGFLVREDKDSISVAQEWCDRDQTVRGTSHIPRSCIVRVARLGRGKSKRKNR